MDILSAIDPNQFPRGSLIMKGGQRDFDGQVQIESVLGGYWSYELNYAAIETMCTTDQHFHTIH